jgi:hypothetical protein
MPSTTTDRVVGNLADGGWGRKNVDGALISKWADWTWFLYERSERSSRP